MSKPLDIVFLFDVDNTLIDNDRVQADLKEHLEQAYGAAARNRYWEILEKLQKELGTGATRISQQAGSPLSPGALQ